MAVKEKSPAPITGRSESEKLHTPIKPAPTPAPPIQNIKRLTETSAAQTSEQRARLSITMQQRLGNARSEQILGAARPTTPIVSVAPPLTARVPLVTTTVTLPLATRKLAPETEITKAATEPAKVPTKQVSSAPEDLRKPPNPKEVAAKTETAVAAEPVVAQVAPQESAATPVAKAATDSTSPEKAGTESKEGKETKEGKGAAEGQAKAPGAAGEKKATAEGEAKLPEEGAAGSGPVTIKIHMPEPPAEMSAKTKRRIGGVKKRAASTAKAHGDLPDGSSQVGDARKSVDEPDTEAIAKAQAELINQVQAAPSPEIVKLCERIREVIRKKRPPDEDALMEAEPEGAALDAGNQLNETVEGESKKVQDNYAGMNQPPAAEAAKGAELPPQPETAETAPINAKAATPDAVPDQNVSLDADVADNKQKMVDAGMEKKTAKLVKTGPVAEARGAQEELEQTAKEDPAKVLADQQASLAKAEGDMAALQAHALAALTVSRKGSEKKATSHQESMVGSEESMRTKASADAKKIFDDTQKSVNALLQPLATNAMAEWEAAKTILVGKFKADLAPVQKRVDDRHSGVGGFFVGLWDAVTGLPDWAEEAYTNAERNFGDGVIAKLTEISIKVNSVIATCDTLIKDARAQIKKIFDDLPQSLRTWADGEQAKFDEGLNKLQNKVTSTRDNFNKDLTQRAASAVDEVRAEIADLRKKASGIIGRIVNAVKRFVDDPIKFIIDGLLDLLGIPPPTFWAVVRKIKKAISDIADDPETFANNFFAGVGKGFSQFFDNFGKHLIGGFIDWLTGGLADAGVHLPKDFSLKSIITFFLELMGITWPRIRKLVAKHVGEKNVALLEKVYSLLSLLIEKGPEGIYEMIKEKLDPQAIVDQVIKMAVDFMITAIIKAATARILLLFNPVGAILQAIEAIYRVLKWIFENAARIFSLIETIVNGIADIIAGNIGGFANAVEKALAKLIAPVISFIADYCGFGDLPKKISEKIKEFQEWILGLIDQAIGWLVEKGKSLLAALGIGKKEEKKDKKGGGEEQVGEEIDFEAGEESHRLWIDLSGTNATLMVASTQQSVNQYLSHVERNGPPELSRKATEARTLAAATDQDADEVAKIAVHIPEKDESESRQELTQRQNKLKGNEKKLAELLKAIFEGMNPIKPRLGKPVDDMTKSPYGYELWTESGEYEYGGSYSNTEVQRGAGLGSADEKYFPMVHVDRDALVQEGPGLLRSDWPVIDTYESEIAGVEKRLKDDGAPMLQGGPYGPSTQLRAGARKQRAFNRGVRKQMEAIVKAIRAGEDITGIEVGVGTRRIDYTTRTKIDGKTLNNLVEYKHWTGKLPPARRAELSTKLQAQLEGQISGSAGRYSNLIVLWPAFGDLDPTSQARFREVIEDVKSFGLTKGVTVIF